jgi:hypothetical protein
VVEVFTVVPETVRDTIVLVGQLESESSVELLSRPGTFLGLPVNAPSASGPREAQPLAGMTAEVQAPAGVTAEVQAPAAVSRPAPRRRMIALVAGALVAAVVVLAIAAERREVELEKTQVRAALRRRGRRAWSRPASGCAAAPSW